MTRCTIGLMAHNEEQQIVPALHALLQQRTASAEIAEIIVVASGCTDRTVDLAEAVAAEHPLVTVLAEPERRGKAAAINSLIALARGEVVVLAGADTLLDPEAIEQLLAPFADPAVGMTGGRPVPLNDPRGFMGFTAQMLWHLHHRMALRWPKLGELVAFRNVVPGLPTDAATDEVALEAILSAAGYRLVYTPGAVVYNYGPETLDDFLAQRRRIFAGHIRIARTYGYIAASMPVRHLLTLAGDAAGGYPSLVPRMAGAVLLECAARTLGTLDAALGQRHHIWRRIASTKRLNRRGGPITLLTLFCRAGTINPARMLGRSARIPADLGLLFWWDHVSHEVRFAVPGAGLSAAELHARVAELAEQVASGPHDVLAYRAVALDRRPAPLPEDAAPAAQSAAEDSHTVALNSYERGLT